MSWAMNRHIINLIIEFTTTYYEYILSGEGVSMDWPMQSIVWKCAIFIDSSYEPPGTCNVVSNQIFSSALTNSLKKTSSVSLGQGIKLSNI